MHRTLSFIIRSCRMTFLRTQGFSGSCCSRILHRTQTCREHSFGVSCCRRACTDHRSLELAVAGGPCLKPLGLLYVELALARKPCAKHRVRISCCRKTLQGHFLQPPQRMLGIILRTGYEVLPATKAEGCNDPNCGAAGGSHLRPPRRIQRPYCNLHEGSNGPTCDLHGGFKNPTCNLYGGFKNPTSNLHGGF